MENEVSRMFGANEVRIVMDENNEPLFVAKDVYALLGYTKDGRAKHGAWVRCQRVHPIADTLGREQDTKVINESELYDVVFDSHKPEAKAFRKWVTNEVLPAIRKTGGYVANEAAMLEEFGAKLMDRISELQMAKVSGGSSFKVYTVTELGKLCNPVLQPHEVNVLLESRGFLRGVMMPVSSGRALGWIPTERAFGLYQRNANQTRGRSKAGEFVPEVKWLASVLGLVD